MELEGGTQGFYFTFVPGEQTFQGSKINITGDRLDQFQLTCTSASPELNLEIKDVLRGAKLKTDYCADVVH